MSSTSARPVTAAPQHGHHLGAPIGVVVVNFGSSALVEANLGSLDVADAPVQIVVVDNYSDSAERDRVRALASSRNWRLVETDANLGFGAGCNRGAAAARELGCTSLLFLNPDAVIGAAAVLALRDHVLAEPAALVSPRIVNADGHLVFRESEVQMSNGQMHPVRTAAGGATVPSGRRRWLSAACLAVHADLFDAVGGFYEPFFLYWEDVDLSVRCVDAGAKLVVRDDLRAVHDEGGTQGVRNGTAKSNTYYYYNCRNRLLFGARHLPGRQLFRWLLATPNASKDIVLRGGRHQLLHSTRPVTSAARGSAAGMRAAVTWAVQSRRADRRARRAVESGSPARVLVAHPGAELYGSDRVMLETVAGLCEQGRSVTVSLPMDGPLVEALRAAGADVVFTRSAVLRKSALRPAGFVRMAAAAMAGLVPSARLVRTAGRDGVYVSTTTIPLWTVLGRVLRRPTTVHVHEAESSAPRWLRRAMACPLLCADRIVVNSVFSLATLADALPAVRSRAQVVLNAIAGPPAPAPARTELAGPIRLLYVGRLSARKGPQVAVAVLEKLNRRGVDARLALLGSVFPGYEWFERQLRESVEQAGLTDRVDFLGFRTDVWADLAAADIVLIPSVMDEPFGNTAVEAVLAARPVVASSTSGLLEAVAGYTAAQTVDPSAPELWADAVCKVAANWTYYRSAAVADAAVAAARHSPQRYRDTIVAILDAPARSS